MAKKKKQAKNQQKNEITKGIFTVLEEQPSKSFNYKQIAAKMGVTDTQGRNLLIKRLGELKQKQRIVEVERGRYQKKADHKELLTGTLDMTSSGNGYVIVDALDDDVFVPEHKLNKALHGDTVEIFYRTKRNSSRFEGEVVKVLERKKKKYVGIVDKQKTFAFVRPMDPKMYTDIFVPLEKINKANHGDKVVVELKEWPENADSPFGAVIEVLGKPGEHETEIHSILAEYGLPHEFPYEVQQFANSIDTSIKADEIAKRKDMREVLTLTIDPKDAKDFDDALSFEVLDNGNYQIGVHIADVSHYLKPGTVLDDEAYNRATSVYLVDRTVPMLPEILSNKACSLRPNEEKYTFSALFEMDKEGRVHQQWFGRTVINSNERFAYEEAQFIIEHQTNTIPKEVSIREGAYEVSQELIDAILEMNQLALKLRQQRMRAGAISFDSIEVRFNLDENNNPESVYFKEQKEANKLIEEFMLLANRKVAEFIGKQQPKKTFVYRIHDEPDIDKLMALNGLISKFGHSLNLKDKKNISNSLNQLLADVKGKKEQNLVDTLTVRSMSKAVYTIDNIGHYGLAFDYYTHFTSPIRRYPDVMVHRLLQHYLDGGKSEKQEVYEEKCKHSSQMEVLASQAERDSIKYMQIKFMQDHRNQEFVGVISGVTEWGVYVEIIENKCEGMIRIRDLKDDYYTFDDRQYAIIGQRNGEMYQLGDEVMVMVKDVDLMKRHLDFSLIGKHQ